MAERGKFIVLEGIDGSGKRTQLQLLAGAMAERGVPCELVSFPNYSGFHGKMVAQYLNGEFGALDAVDPHFSALLYAGDRLESKPALEASLASGKTLLADRYVGSNLAHQGARVDRAKRPEFLAWLRELEYRVHGLPVEDLVIYLRVPAEQAHDLIGKKGARDYTTRPRDLQEENRSHLAEAAAVYEELARQPGWAKIDCVDAATDELRTPQSIHHDILGVIASRIPASAQVVR